MSDLSKLLRQAFEASLDVLGEQTKRALIQDLEAHGIYLNDPLLSLPTLEQALKQIIGDEATALIMERVSKKLDKLQRYRR